MNRKILTYFIYLLIVIILDYSVCHSAVVCVVPSAKSTLEQTLQEQEQHLRKLKAKKIDSLKKMLFTEEKASYNKILKKIGKILQDPADARKKTKGGQERIDEGINLLNELIKIHKEEVYCTIAKQGRIQGLLKRSKDSLLKFEAQKEERLFCERIYSGNIDELEEETKSFLNDLILGKRLTTTVGGNIVIGLGFMGGLGSTVGISKNPCGYSRVIVNGQAVGGYWGIINMAAGAYQVEQKKSKAGLVGCVMSPNLTVGLGGGAWNNNWENKPNLPVSKYIEVGLGFMGGVKGVLLGGLN